MNYNMINHFNSNIAVAYGINASIFIQALSQWTFNNLANKRHLHDGYCWSYNTLEAYETIFPWWSKRQLETLIASLVKDGLIVKGNYNKHKYDRTCWYALSYMAMEFYPELITQDNIKALLGTISPKWEMETPDFYGNTILEKHFTEMRNGIHQNVTPIPTSNSTKDNISKDILGNQLEDEIKQTSKPKKGTFGVKELKEDNPHDIPESMLSDWLEVRNIKKNKVTATAWNKINKTLSVIEQKLNIKPHDAFETMVTRAWQSLELEYFQNNNAGSAGTTSQGTGIKDSNGNDITWE
jgi:hypothetical protein